MFKLKQLIQMLWRQFFFFFASKLRCRSAILTIIFTLCLKPPKCVACAYSFFFLSRDILQIISLNPDLYMLLSFFFSRSCAINIHYSIVFGFLLKLVVV
uniref:Uncharacterized protein n=1 Tax=Ixodes ricinus TaxID=34613 RepID=A0A6B0U5K0_IXORI